MTKLARVYHPDTGGSQEQMIRVNAAYDAARASLEDS
jgi:curved DNA-binding protein CbpA